MPRRPTVSKTEIEAAVKVLEASGAKIATVEITPGRVLITTTHAEDLGLEDMQRLQHDDLARQQDRIGEYGLSRRKISQPVLSFRERLKESWPGDARHKELKDKWGFLLNHVQAERFSKLNPNWTGPEDPRYEWPKGTRH
jgi:hypothetical protein